MGEWMYRSTKGMRMKHNTKRIGKHNIIDEYKVITVFIYNNSGGYE
jgi:hypothetical protein